jgi:hypothetical protein
MHYRDDREVAAQIGAREPAFGGGYRSDDLGATAACEPRPNQGILRCFEPPERSGQRRKMLG